MRRCLGPTLVALVFAALGLAGSASALQPGVFVDPNSPAGKEYSFPLSVLRAQGAGRANAPAGAAQPLFGIGVTRVGATLVPGGSRGSSASAGSGSTRRGAGPTRGSSGAASVRAGGLRSGGTGSGNGTPSIPQAALIRLAKPGSAVPAVALITALALAAGLALAVGLRVLGRRS